jgi:thiamine-phosphate pyrophosphorylase
MKYCLITDRNLYQQELPEVAAAAESAGVDYFQLREKDLSPCDLLLMARRIRSILKQTIFIVNGSLDVALACSADGVHLQSENIPVDAVRSREAGLIIGYSAHSFREMQAAEKNGATYVFISPVFEPRSKVSTLPALGAACVAKWSGSVRIPAFALGGVSMENIHALDQAGIRSVAGISLFIREGKFTDAGMVI